ncbi:hypothetical protein C8J56DRAFT_144268 [Mycena floridula]|nr:hypothetical protein C8J56DRAFT_144268 [Mycena floridula]
MYHCTVLEEEWQAKSFCEIMLGRSQLICPNHIRTLCIIPQLDVHELLGVFSVCSNVDTLGIYNWKDDDKSMAQLDKSLYALAMSGPQPSKLCCDARWTFKLRPEGLPDAHRFILPLFQNLTHLELYSNENFLGFNVKHLHALRKLTHLALIMQDMIEAHPSLEVLLRLSLANSILVCIVFIGRKYDLGQLRLTDPRVVFSLPEWRSNRSNFKTILSRTISDSRHFVRQWGRRGPGEEEELDMWEEAQAIVAVQRRALLLQTARRQ